MSQIISSHLRSIGCNSVAKNPPSSLFLYCPHGSSAVSSFPWQTSSTSAVRSGIAGSWLAPLKSLQILLPAWKSSLSVLLWLRLNNVCWLAILDYFVTTGSSFWARRQAELFCHIIRAGVKSCMMSVWKKQGSMILYQRQGLLLPRFSAYFAT